MMRFVLTILSLLVPSLAWAAEPFVRATVEDDGKIVPGQQVRVDVDVLTPDFFTSPPQFPLFDIPNALVTLPEERSQNLTETIDGMQYSGIRKAYLVVPQVSGTFIVPEVQIEFGYSVGGKPARGAVKMPPVSFAVAAPASGGQPITFAASNLTIEQSLDPVAPSLKVGDALVRTITVTAGDTQAMMIPPIDVGTVAGLRQYLKPPKIEDGVDSGREAVSRRTETYVYTAEKDGSFVLPAVSYVWFDVESHAMKTATLSSATVSVSAVASETAIKPVLDEKPQPSPHVARQRIALAIALALAAAALLWLACRLQPRLARYLREARERHHASYTSRLKQLRTTILSGTEAEIYVGLHEWSRTLGYRTLNDWLRDGPDRLNRQVDNLSRVMFRSGGESIDRQAMAADVDFRHQTRKTGASALPPLNPAATT